MYYYLNERIVNTIIGTCKLGRVVYYAEYTSVKNP